MFQVNAGVAQLVEQLTVISRLRVQVPSPAPFSALFKSALRRGARGLKGADCKSVGSAYDGSNPSPSTIFLPVNGW